MGGQARLTLLYAARNRDATGRGAQVPGDFMSSAAAARGAPWETTLFRAKAYRLPGLPLHSDAYGSRLKRRSRMYAHPLIGRTDAPAVVPALLQPKRRLAAAPLVEKILLPTDGSRLEQAALDYVTRLAGSMRLSVHLLNVQ